MNNFHRYLNFPVSLVPENDIESFLNSFLETINVNKLFNKERPNEGFHYFKLPIEQLPKHFAKWFEDTFPGVYIKDWEVFYTPPGCKHPPHSDGFYPYIDFTKINYVFNNKDSSMTWYSLADSYTRDINRIEADKKESPYNTSVTYLPVEVCIPEYTSTIDKPSLVNVGQPHGVDNTNNAEGRWCICLFPNFKNPQRRVLFNESLDIFKDYIE